MYAVVKTGGKQYKVSEGDRLRVEKLDAPVGDTVELSEIAMLAKEDDIVVDSSALESVKVICEVVRQDRAKKIRVFKKKRRKNYMRTYGHRQSFTELRVEKIQA